MKIKKIILLLTYIFFIFLFIEVLSYIYLNSKIDATFPNYNLKSRTHYLDINKIFGPWHEPNSSFRHRKSCFDVNYEFNSIGARDKEFNKTGKNRIFLLGDSYAEGYGLNYEETIDFQLEKRLNREILNFGTSGHFGTTQERLLYEFFYESYEHDTVLQILTIANDFEDDSYEFSMKNAVTKNRYRPYLIKNSDNFEIIYHGDFDANSKGQLKNIKKYLANFTYTYNLIKYLRSLYLSKKKSNITNKLIDYYNDFDKNILDIFKYNIDKINEITKKNNIQYILVLAPDFHHLKINLGRITNINKELMNYADKKNIVFVDLMTEINLGGYNIDKMFYGKTNHGCDAHPNPYGIEVFSEILKNKIVGN